MGLTVGDFFRFARESFAMSPVGVSGQVAEAQKTVSQNFAQSPLNLETAHEAAQVETNHLLGTRLPPPETQADKLALLASIGKGFAARNLGARLIGSMLPDAYVSKDPKEQAILTMHKRNLNDISNF